MIMTPTFSLTFFLRGTVSFFVAFAAFTGTIAFSTMIASGTAVASPEGSGFRPKPFVFRDGQAVFADFTEARYEITYDLNRSIARAKARIAFELGEEGYPVFDSVTAPDSIVLDGTPVQAIETRTPSNETTLRVIAKKASPGAHRLEIDLPLVSLVKFGQDGVRSAFWTSDLDERNFLERYLPSNLEYDQVKMNFVVRFAGLRQEQLIYTNGQVQRIDAGTYSIDFPAHFTSSSIFFHTTPKGSTLERSFQIRSIDGRVLPVMIYSAYSALGSPLDGLQNRVTKVIAELEAAYGPFPHPSVLVLNAGMGGMEYCGATMTDVSSVGHELFHSYFARGVMPANGNAGWIDEALASWRDNGYPSSSSFSGGSSMSSHPYYTRITDRAAYSFGARFMSYLDWKTRDKGGLKPFLKFMVQTQTFRPFLIEEFIAEMSRFYGVGFDGDFQRHTFSTGRSLQEMARDEEAPHPKMSLEELERLL